MSIIQMLHAVDKPADQICYNLFTSLHEKIFKSKTKILPGDASRRCGSNSAFKDGSLSKEKADARGFTVKSR